MNPSVLRGCRWEVCYSRSWGCGAAVAEAGDFERCQDPTGGAGDPAPRGCAWWCTHSRAHAPREAMQGARHPKEQQRPPHLCFSILPPTPGTKRCRAPLCCIHTPGRSQALSGPTPCTHAGQHPAVTQRAGTRRRWVLPRELGSGGGKPALGAEPSTPGEQPLLRLAPSQHRPGRGACTTLSTTPRGAQLPALSLLPCCGPMAGAGTGLSWAGGCWVGWCRVGGCWVGGWVLGSVTHGAPGIWGICRWPSGGLVRGLWSLRGVQG